MSEYRIETGMSTVEKWMWADEMDAYRTVKTSCGAKYRVRMTAEEIEDRRRAGLAAAVAIMMPVCIGILAAAAGLFG